MNKLNKFAAQQLSKSQMNKVTGGVTCTAFLNQMVKRSQLQLLMPMKWLK